jgi:hypothetical protein
MTLSAPMAVAFSVVAGLPADARQWITVDLAGYPGSGRRGYVVASEPIGSAWNALTISTRIREVIVSELRRRQHMPVDEALGRALAVANGVVTNQGRDQALNGPERAPLVGITAIVFDGDQATIAHLPPGQLILIQDGLIYTVPEFDSWFPTYQPRDIPGRQAEPLGYARWTAPLIAQTDLRPGDSMILTSQDLGRALAEEMASSGLDANDLARLHHRDPDQVLDFAREIVIDRDMHAAAAAVVSFPPLPSSHEIQTFADVKRRTGDRWRHLKATLRRAEKPVVVAIEPDSEYVDPPAVEPTVPAAPQESRPNQVLQSVNKIFEPRARQAPWRKPPEHTQLGVPGKHGVDIFRGQTHYMGDQSWRNNLPRLPIIGSAWIWPVLLLIVAGVVLGAMTIRDRYEEPEVDVGATIDQIDRAIVAARDENDPVEAAEELNAILDQIELARNESVPGDMLDQRELAVTELLDDVTNVIRTSDVQRIGTLPEEFGDARVQGIFTPAGVFFVAGSLYQYRPNPASDTPDLVTILEEGATVGSASVGSLWGVAFDVHGLYATDGNSVFMLPVESQEWKAVELGRINNQPWMPGPVAAFDGALYLLQAEYRQIYRFPIEGTEDVAAPRDWLQTGARDRINDATDIAIDGNIYVLLDDGTIQVMLRGDLDQVLEPAYVEPDLATALSGPGGSGYLYAVVNVEDSDDGRIVAFDTEGQNAVQLRLPIGFTTGDVDVRMPFDGVQDVIVDESTGTIYIINADAIWTTRYSLPALPEEENDGEPADTEVEGTPIA